MKRILVMNFFPAFVPPASGGELRYFHLYNELSKTYDVTLLSPTYSHHSFEVIEHHPHFREYRVPKVPEIHDALHVQLDQKDIGREKSALVCAISAKYPNRYHEMYLELYDKCDLIIHEFPYMLDYDLFFGIDHKPRIYNSHNFESKLVEQIWPGKDAAPYISMIKKMEEKLVRHCDLVFATSEEEKRAFIETFHVNGDKIRIAPNGIIPDLVARTPKLASHRLSAFFIGSSHAPNIEAVQFLLDEVVDACPDVEFWIAGSCCDAFSNVRKKNVRLLGRVDEKEKNKLFATCDIAINPMFSGAGTNLKTLEFLAAGIPLASTRFGVRGLGLENGVHYIEVDKSDFSSTLNGLVQNRDKLNEIAAAGKETISRNYSWKSIARQVSEGIQKLALRQPAQRKTILLLNDFEASPGAMGGQVRIKQLYSALSVEYNIVLVCLNNEGRIRRTDITENFIEISVPKTKKHLDEEEKISGVFRVSAVDIVSAMMVARNELLQIIARKIYDLSDLVILIHPYMYPVIENLKGKPLIYESLNAEYVLKKEILKGHPMYDELISIVHKVEKAACEQSDLIVSVSDDDHGMLRELIPEMDKEIVTIENGVDFKNQDTDVSTVKAWFHPHPVILFVGSSHMPNVEALDYIVKELAPYVKAYFIIIGSVCEAINRAIVPDNVLLFGRLSEEQKNILMRVADLAVNPIVSGSGSNLKLADYMMSRLPVVTTPFGARGYKIEPDVHAAVCEINQFRMKIEELLADEQARASMAQAGYEYVSKNLNWHALAAKMSNVLRRKFDFDSGEKRKRLLVITYRFTDPPLGGAEVYLLNLIKELDAIGDFTIDVVTTNIYDISNKYHFSSRYTYDSSFPTNMFRNVNVLKFDVDVQDDRELLKNARQLYSVWMKESIRMSYEYLCDYPKPLLMGGWYYPERNNRQVEVWTSDEAVVYLGDDVKEVIVSGFSPKRRKLNLAAENRVVCSKSVSGFFSVLLNVNGARTLAFNIDPYYADQDPRALGVKITSIEIRKFDGEAGQIKLDYNFRDFLRETRHEDYIEALIRNAKARDQSVDELFQKTRGPISSSMNSWLKQNITKYDIIFGHSIPFHTSVVAADFGSRYNIPVVLLPHFHTDDQFYHWRSYYDALVAARKVIAFPRQSIPYFYDKIGASAVFLPGGAVYESEFVNPPEFEHGSAEDVPFVLVLGRKAPAKNYQAVIEAVDKLNETGTPCKLVMIGKDEDQTPINSRHTLYLGEQPRPQVLAALNACKMLVAMSESESFGIVILEAWMMKKPVIVNERCNAYLELVENNVNGLVSDREHLAEKIKVLLDDERLCDELGQNGYKKVGERFTWRSVGREINQLLHQTLSASTN